MLRAARIIAAKDLLLTAKRGGALVQAVLLGLLLVVLFSLSTGGSVQPDPVGAAAVFWLASVFCLTILSTALFSLEETNMARRGLLLAPVPVQAIWLGKSMAALCLLLLVQAALLLASVIFLGQRWTTSAPLALAGLVLVDLGAVCLSALLASLTRGQAVRESLCSLVVFPLLLPQFLAGVRMLASAYGAAGPPPTDWLGFAAAFDAVFTGAALVLFPVIYGGDA